MVGSRQLLLVLLAGSSLSAPLGPDYHVVKEDGVTEMGAGHDNTIIKYVEQPLLEKAVNNFRCKVTNYTITQDSPFSSPTGATDDSLNETEVRMIIGRTSEIEWAHMTNYYYSDISGRHTDPIVGTLGGDIGEFILSTAVYEDVTGEKLTQQQVTSGLQSLISTLARKKFYMMQTEEGLKNLTPEEICTKFDIANPPEQAKVSLLDAVVKPENVGCLHLKALLNNPGLFRTRLELVQYGIKAFYQTMWNKTYDYNTKLSYMVVRQPPDMERALVRIETDQHCLDQGLVPLINTHNACLGNRTMFVQHNQAVNNFRLTLAHFWGAGDGPMTQRLETKIYVKSLLYLAKSALALFPATSYPVYTVKLYYDSKSDPYDSYKPVPEQ